MLLVLELLNFCLDEVQTWTKTRKTRFCDTKSRFMFKFHEHFDIGNASNRFCWTYGCVSDELHPSANISLFLVVLAGRSSGFEVRNKQISVARAIGFKANFGEEKDGKALGWGRCLEVSNVGEQPDIPETPWFLLDKDLGLLAHDLIVTFGMMFFSGGGSFQS